MKITLSEKTGRSGLGRHGADPRLDGGTRDGSGRDRPDPRIRYGVCRGFVTADALVKGLRVEAIA